MHKYRETAQNPGKLLSFSDRHGLLDFFMVPRGSRSSESVGACFGFWRDFILLFLIDILCLASGIPRVELLPVESGEGRERWRLVVSDGRRTGRRTRIRSEEEIGEVKGRLGGLGSQDATHMFSRVLGLFHSGDFCRIVCVRCGLRPTRGSLSFILLSFRGSSWCECYPHCTSRK